MEGRAVVDEFLRPRCVLHIAACIRLRKRVPVLRRRIDESRLAVIDLVDARVLYESEVDRAARDRAGAVDLPAAALQLLSAEGIVSDFDGVSAGLDVVHDFGCLKRICRRVFRRRGELCAGTREAERHIVARNDTRPGAAARQNRPARRNVIDVCPIVLLRRSRHGSHAVDDMEIIRIEVAAVDGSLAIGICIHGVVACRECAELRIERFLHVRILNIVRRAVACIGIWGERRPREAAVVTVIVARCRPHHRVVAGREVRCRHIVVAQDVTDYGAVHRIGDLRYGRGRIACIPVIGLRYVCHLDLQRTRRDLAGIDNGQRRIQRHGRSRACARR